MITMTVAVATSKHGVPPPLSIRQSFSGANIHGILGGPLIDLGLGLWSVRLVMFVAGGFIVLLFASYLQKLDNSRMGLVIGTLLLILTPHFVLYTGYAGPMAITMAFGILSVVGYSRHLDTGQLVSWWLLPIGIGTAFATINHFWGGIVAVTILGFEFLTFLGTDESGRSKVLKRGVVLGLVLGIALIPGGALYIYYDLYTTGQAKYIFEHYGGYAVWSAPLELVSAAFYIRILRWSILYLPQFLLALGILFAVRDSIRPRFLLKERTDHSQPRLNALGIWTTWLAGGIMVILVLPRGAFIHDYYLWWALLPATGLIVWAVDNVEVFPNRHARRIGNVSVPQVFLLGLILMSAALTGFHVARGPVDRSDVFGGAESPDIATHSKELANVLDSYVDEETRVLAYSNGTSLTTIRLALIRIGAVELSRAAVVKSDEQVDIQTYDVVVSPEQLDGYLGENWTRVSTVEAAGYTSYIYVSGR